MIFGRPGSGKSTFALWLHDITNIPLHHLDKHFFISNWAERDYGEFMSIQEQIVAGKQWIIDGNSLKSLATRLSKAEVCIYFNYPKLLCIWQLVKRLVTKNLLIDDRAPGCKEKLSWKLIWYTWTFEKRILKRNFWPLIDQYKGVKFIEIKSDDDLQNLKNYFLRAHK